MIIKIKNASDIASGEITPQDLFLARRGFIKNASVGAMGLALGAVPQLASAGDCDKIVANQLLAGEKLNSFEEITSYNNFYEYSPDKEAVRELAKNLQPRPWTIRIEGEVEKRTTLDVSQLINDHRIVERVYRLRCVEGWSMVIPWQGIPLCQLLNQIQPSSRARYVEFVTKLDTTTFYGQRRNTMEWPYREGLRIDEAMNPLTLLATGLYGEAMPNQNGAPIRLIVPWKYGFKSIKSIVKIRLTERQPLTSWPGISPGEYGFFANVNPDVDHPRWSQRRENRIGEFKKRPTLPFNGYQEEVAHLYTGMDLAKYY